MSARLEIIYYHDTDRRPMTLELDMTLVIFQYVQIVLPFRKISTYNQLSRQNLLIQLSKLSSWFE